MTTAYPSTAVHVGRLTLGVGTTCKCTGNSWTPQRFTKLSRRTLQFQGFSTGWSRSCALRIGFQPCRIVGLTHLASSERKRAQHRIHFVRAKTKIVELQKERCGGETNPLVAIGERVIPDQAESIACGKFEQRRLAVSKKILRSTQCRFKQAFVTDAGGPAMLGKQPFVKREHDIAPHPHRLLHFASSRSVLR